MTHSYHHVVFLLVFFKTSLCKATSQSIMDAEAKLFEQLFENYHRTIIPRSNNTSPLRVGIGVILQRIVEVDETLEFITLDMWRSQTWDDVRLKWKPTNYKGINSINVRVDKLWTPDIALFNSVGDVYTALHERLAVITSNGRVSYVPPILTKVSCKFDWAYFPYDTQECHLRFGSWSFNGDQLDLEIQSDKIDMATYQPHDSWEISQSPVVVRHVQRFECCPEPYIEIMVTLFLKRRSGYLITLFVAPAVVLAILVPFIFFFPPESGEKITLGVGLEVSFILLLVLFDSYNPTAMAAPPIIVLFYIANIVLVGAVMILSMIFVHLWRDRWRLDPPPRCLTQVFVDCLGSCLCLNRGNYLAPQHVSLSEREPDDGDAADDDMAKLDRESRASRLEWRLLAMALDRTFFVVFLMISLATLIITMLML